MTIGERIKQRRMALGLSADQVAEQLNVDRTTVFRYERGAISKVPTDTLAKLAQILYTSPTYLMGLSDEAGRDVKIDNIYQIETTKIPLLGEIACGEPVYANEDRESYVEAGTSIKADFCLKCKGDSMINARIHDGDIVFIRKQPTVNNGEIAVVLIEDEATLKRVFYYQDQSKLILQAENPTFEPLVYIGEEINKIRILGKAVAFQSDVK